MIGRLTTIASKEALDVTPEVRTSTISNCNDH
jgi:hypothetical protein